MRKTIVLVLAAACLGLLLACPDPEPTPSPGPTEYTVTFDANATGVTGAGQAPSPIKVKSGETLGAKLVKMADTSSHTFDGWFTQQTAGIEFRSDTKVTSNITVYGRWTPVASGAFLVTFNKNHTDNNATAPWTDANPTSKLSDATTKVVNPLPTAPTRTGHTFAGWFDTANASGGTEFTNTTQVTAVRTVYARWTAGGGVEKVTISFNLGAGKIAGSATLAAAEIDKGSSLGAKFPVDPTPDAADKVFGAWYKEATGGTVPVTAQTTFDANATLYAYYVDASSAFTVTFNSNVPTGEAGSTPANPASKQVVGTVGTLPTPPTRSGWGAGFYFDGWYTTASGGTAVTATTPVTAAMEVFAHWTVFTPGKWEVVEDALVIIAPVTETNTGDGGTQGNWVGTGPAEDGSFTYSGGAIRTIFADAGVTPTPTYVLTDYDFVTLEYVQTGGLHVILKQGTTGSNFIPFAPANQYPTLGASGSFEFLIKSAGYDSGIAFQINDSTDGTLKFTKLTFTKGTRYAITFNADDSTSTPPYTAPAIQSMQAVGGYAIGTLPSPAARAGYTFLQWLNGETGVTPATVMPTSALALTAKWEQNVTVTEKVVDFSAVTFTTMGAPSGGTAASVTGITGLTGTPPRGSSYIFTHGGGYSGNEYQQFAKFKLDLGAVSLHQYTSITFTINGTAGDTNYKAAYILAAKTLAAFNSQPAGDVINITTYKADAYNYSSGSQTLTLTIDKANAMGAAGTGLSGEVEFAIYTESNSHSGGTATKYTITNMIFNP
jgi:uncharacterized repeat protein (TIGR02543 family)